MALIRTIRYEQSIHEIMNVIEKNKFIDYDGVLRSFLNNYSYCNKNSIDYMYVFNKLLENTRDFEGCLNIALCRSYKLTDEIVYKIFEKTTDFKECLENLEVLSHINPDYIKKLFERVDKLENNHIKIVIKKYNNNIDLLNLAISKTTNFDGCLIVALKNCPEYINLINFLFEKETNFKYCLNESILLNKILPRNFIYKILEKSKYFSNSLEYAILNLPTDYYLINKLIEKTEIFDCFLLLTAIESDLDISFVNIILEKATSFEFCVYRAIKVRPKEKNFISKLIKYSDYCENLRIVIEYCSDDHELIKKTIENERNFRNCLQLAIKYCPTYLDLIYFLIDKTYDFEGCVENAIKYCPENTDLIKYLINKIKKCDYNNYLKLAIESIEIEDEIIDILLEKTVIFIKYLNGNQINKLFERVKFIDFDSGLELYRENFAINFRELNFRLIKTEELLKYKVHFFQNNTKCIICSTGFKDYDYISISNCGHLYHMNCTNLINVIKCFCS